MGGERRYGIRSESNNGASNPFHNSLFHVFFSFVSFVSFTFESEILFGVGAILFFLLCSVCLVVSVVVHSVRKVFGLMLVPVGAVH